MDSEAWVLQSIRAQRIRHNLATEQQNSTHREPQGLCTPTALIFCTLISQWSCNPIPCLSHFPDTLSSRGCSLNVFWITPVKSCF